MPGFTPGQPACFKMFAYNQLRKYSVAELANLIPPAFLKRPKHGIQQASAWMISIQCRHSFWTTPGCREN
jgi:hypothetical protein